MTREYRLALTVAVVFASCVAGTSSADSDRRAQKLLQMQTLNRMASEAAPVKKKSFARRKYQPERRSKPSVVPAKAGQPWRSLQRNARTALAMGYAIQSRRRLEHPASNRLPVKD